MFKRDDHNRPYVTKEAMKNQELLSFLPNDIKIYNYSQSISYGSLVQPRPAPEFNVVMDCSVKGVKLELASTGKTQEEVIDNFKTEFASQLQQNAPKGPSP